MMELNLAMRFAEILIIWVATNVMMAMLTTYNWGMMDVRGIHVQLTHDLDVKEEINIQETNAKKSAVMVFTWATNGGIIQVLMNAMTETRDPGMDVMKGAEQKEVGHAVMEIMLDQTYVIQLAVIGLSLMMSNAMMEIMQMEMVATQCAKQRSVSNAREEIIFGKMIAQRYVEMVGTLVI